MKKRIAILGLAGALLCSGISAFAAAGQCGHPAVTLYYGEETVYPSCPDGNGNCKYSEVQLVEYATCHNCFVTFATGKRWTLSHKHE
ncbi:MAG: hypothetical protein NC543_14670 [bacterium]|nr:hypothetical protein [bacterium]MCM1374129.1 hypothetical protein [Muribaculum sp.]